MEGFIYIISARTYNDELRTKKFYKHIPEFIFKNIDSKLYGNIVNEFKVKDETIGYSVGLTTIENLGEEELLYRIEESLENKLPIKKINSIIFEKNYNLSLTKKLIDKEILIATDRSKEIKVQTIPLVLKRILANIDEFNMEIELLIIPKVEGDIDCILHKFSSDVKFISIYTENEELGNKIINKVMNDTGLAIGIISDISKINRFDIIINFKDDIKFKKWVKQKSIIFNIYNNISYDNKKGIVIDDFTFNNSGIIKNTNIRMDEIKEIPSIIYSYNNKFAERDFRRLRVGKNLYSIKEFCDKYSMKTKYLTVK
ncbi:hypothetical protein GOQ27_03730 [Clostridium sp. D2Q-11]|uniref:Uncharacterized protein n=1 Tax=Anaeromonas frigoriresistens TaxID=2683708 RepID=A0A942UZZ2_9FIRM|nr:hypothetical protein [Anaeromonas frigoriresistens]MBS4537557.1 hypothetical protein [Anaeromonas frigoriresistens]